MGQINTIHIGGVVTEVPVEMNGAGCGIEFIEHEIYGGLSSQLVVGESFEEPFNASTGISVQWAIGGGGVGGGRSGGGGDGGEDGSGGEGGGGVQELCVHTIDESYPQPEPQHTLTSLASHRRIP